LMANNHIHTKNKFMIRTFFCLAVVIFAPEIYVRSEAMLSAPHLSKLEKEVAEEINLARQYPKRYALLLEKRKPYYHGKSYTLPGKVTIMTKEGVKALDEAVRFLRKAKPLKPMHYSKGMSQAAKDHVKDQGPTGKLAHTGTDGSQPWDRVSRFGKWQVTVGENIAYGDKTARDIVIGLIVDDGVPGRGHRKNIFNPEFRVIGVAFGYHKKYGTMCVIDFAGGFEER
ncbi:MAG: CAP domain-containing protein, partial [bacterium]